MSLVPNSLQIVIKTVRLFWSSLYFETRDKHRDLCTIKLMEIYFYFLSKIYFLRKQNSIVFRNLDPIFFLIFSFEWEVHAVTQPRPWEFRPGK